MCKAGQDNYCVSGTRYLGVNRPGAYSTHVLVPDSKYLVDASGETRVCRDARLLGTDGL